MSDLNARLLVAHTADDIQALVALYIEASDAAADQDAACFYLTHAYVYALEASHPRTPDIRARLVQAGREPDQDALSGSAWDSC